MSGCVSDCHNFVAQEILRFPSRGEGGAGGTACQECCRNIRQKTIQKLQKSFEMFLKECRRNIL